MNEKVLNFNKHLFDLCLIITYFLIFYKFFSLKEEEKCMNLKELNDLIERFGDVQLLEIKEELQKMGYACKIAGDKND